MKIPVLFITFIWFCLYLAARFGVNRRKAAKQEQSFWDKEHEANFARKKPLDDLAYITIDEATLPFARLPLDEKGREAAGRVRELSSERIVNLTGISNTDLKLRYGAANLETLSGFDQNFTLLVTSLQAWGHALLAEQNTDDARRVLEFAVRSGSDISATYKDLAALYAQTLSKDEAQSALTTLLESANTLSSMTKPQLVAFLQERLNALS